MLYWFDKMGRLIELPFKYLKVAALFAGLALFLPKAAVGQLSMDILVEEYRPLLGPVFLFSLCLVLIEVSTVIWKTIYTKRQKSKCNAALIESLSKLDSQEKSVLREFCIQQRNTIQLPYNNAVVSGLLSLGILTVAGSSGERTLAGTLLPIMINRDIEAFITCESIDFPMSDDPSKQEMEWVKNNRPEFIDEIRCHNKLFHKRWNCEV